MSIEAMNWVRETRFGSPTRKLVMYLLANYADAHWSTFVGQERLARECDLSVSSVKRAMAELEAIGVLSRKRRCRGDGRGRGRTSDRTTIHQFEPLRDQGVRELRSTEQRCSQVDFEHDQGVTVTGEPSVTNEPPVTRAAKIIPTEVERLCELMADQLADRGRKRPTTAALKGWHRDMDLLTRLDGRTFHDVEKVLRWLHEGKDEVAEFWRINIRSPAKLRKHWDAMRERYEREVKRQKRDGKVQSWSPASVPTGRQFGGSLA